MATDRIPVSGPTLAAVLLDSENAVDGDSDDSGTGSPLLSAATPALECPPPSLELDGSASGWKAMGPPSPANRSRLPSALSSHSFAYGRPKAAKATSVASWGGEKTHPANVNTSVSSSSSSSRFDDSHDFSSVASDSLPGHHSSMRPTKQLSKPKLQISIPAPPTVTPAATSPLARLAAAVSVQYTDETELEPISPPPASAFLQQIISRLTSTEWKLQFDALTDIRRIAKHHTSTLTSPYLALPKGSLRRTSAGQNFLHHLTNPLIELVDSLRSNVAKNAMLTVHDLFFYCGSEMSDTNIFDPMLSICLRKTGGCGSGNFLLAEAQRALGQLCLSTTAEGKFASLLLRNLREAQKSQKMKAVVAQCMCVVIMRLNTSLITALSAKDLHALILACVKLASEASPESRKYGRFALASLSSFVVDSELKQRGVLCDVEIKEYSVAARQAVRNSEVDTLLGLSAESLWSLFTPSSRRSVDNGHPNMSSASSASSTSSPNVGPTIPKPPRSPTPQTSVKRSKSVSRAPNSSISESRQLGPPGTSTSNLRSTASNSVSVLATPRPHTPRTETPRRPLWSNGISLTNQSNSDLPLMEKELASADGYNGSHRSKTPREAQSGLISSSGSNRKDSVEFKDRRSWTPTPRSSPVASGSRRNDIWRAGGSVVTKRTDSDKGSRINFASAVDSRPDELLPASSSDRRRNITTSNNSSGSNSSGKDRRWAAGADSPQARRRMTGSSEMDFGDMNARLKAAVRRDSLGSSSAGNRMRSVTPAALKSSGHSTASNGSVGVTIDEALELHLPPSAASTSTPRLPHTTSSSGMNSSYASNSPSPKTSPQTDRSPVPTPPPNSRARRSLNRNGNYANSQPKPRAVTPPRSSFAANGRSTSTTGMGRHESVPPLPRRKEQPGAGQKNYTTNNNATSTSINQHHKHSPPQSLLSMSSGGQDSLLESRTAARHSAGALLVDCDDENDYSGDDVLGTSRSRRRRVIRLDEGGSGRSSRSGSGVLLMGRRASAYRPSVG